MMDRLTHERCNGIKSGYWSAAKKEELVQCLATYENTGLTPEEIAGLKDQVEQLKKLLLTVANTGMEPCEICIHSSHPIPDDCECECDRCARLDCPCAGCADGSKWIWRGYE